MTFNLWTFLFEMINFLVLAYVLHRLLYRPLRTAIEQRQAAQAAALTEAETARQQTAEMQVRLQTQTAELDQQRQAALQAARNQAKAERTRFLAEAEQAAERLRTESQRDIERERQEMLAALRTEVVQQSVALTERLIREVAGADLHQQLVEHLVEVLKALPEPERSALRIPGIADDAILLEAAAEVKGPLLQRLESAVSSVLGRPVVVAVRNTPTLISGARLRLGGHVWDASVTGQIEEVRK